MAYSSRWERLPPSFCCQKPPSEKGVLCGAGGVSREVAEEIAEEVEKALTKNGITQALAKKATEIAQKQGRFTIFTLVDALTRMTQEVHNAGDRTEAEQKVGKLLALAA